MKRKDDVLKKGRTKGTSKHKTLQKKVKSSDIKSFLKDRLSQFRDVFESLADAYLIMDISGNVLDMNAAAKDLFGYDIDNESLNVVNIIYKDDYEYAMLSYTKLQEEGNFKGYEARIYTKDKHVKWVQINASLIYDDNQHPIAAQGIIRDITDVKENVEIINNQKKELAAIIDNSTSGIVLSKNDKIIKTNRAMQHMFGFKEQELLGLAIKDLTFQEDYSESASHLHKMDTDSSYDFQIVKRYKRKDKSIFWGKTRVNAVRDIDGNVDYKVAFVEDITLQREEKLIVDVVNDITQSLLGKIDIYDISSEVALKIANYLSTNDCVIYLVDKEKDRVEQIAAFGDKINATGSIINKLVFKIGQGITGAVAKTGKAEIIQDTSKDSRYIVDDVTRYSEICVPIIANGEVIGIIDAEHIEKNYFTEQHLYTLTTISNLVALQFSNAIQLYKISITQDKLVASENQLTTIINSLDTGILLETENREIKNANKKLYELFNIEEDPQDYIGSDLKAIVENEGKYAYADPEGFINELNDIITTRKPVVAQEMLMSDGRVFERDYTPIFDNDVFIAHLWSFRDITFKKKHKEQLDKERRKYSNILENMNLGIIETDIDGVILFANQSFLKISGYTKSELLGKKGNELFIKGESQKTVREAIENRKKGVSYSYEVEVKNKEGNIRYWMISGAPNYDENNNVIGTIGAHLDITDLKTLEIQKEDLLMQLQRSNDELQEYAHVVSHDLKSPLRSVSALISFIREDYNSLIDEEGMKNFDYIENKIDMMDALIEGILSYSSASDMSEPSEKIDLNNLVKGIINVIYVPSYVEIRVKNKLPEVFANKTKLQQVFQNLINNAVSYTDKEKGFVEITYTDKGAFHEFCISDNGIGIAKEHHKKIFEIFQSVKGNNYGKSTGIGLSIVKKIITLYQGDIWVESELGIGSKFYFTLKKN